MAVVSPVDPVSLVLAVPQIIINSAAVALPEMEFALVVVAVVVHLDAFSDAFLGLYLVGLFRVANEPFDGAVGLRRSGEAEEFGAAGGGGCERHGGGGEEEVAQEGRFFPEIVEEEEGGDREK